ncbi:MAG: substrate-binding domain-containing protein, partial [Armatimonadetes bacterium]|nr:substrate-binding domain-containing protein [Armatimonadota bacterium]
MKPGEAGEKIKLGFLVKQPEEKWFQDEWKFARKCAEDLHFEVITLGSSDGPKILQMIQTIASQGAKGFVICTPDTKLGTAIVAKAKEYDLRVFSVDDQFIGPDGKEMTDVPYMCISASEIGKAVGVALADEYKQRGWKAEDTAAAGITFTELATSKARTDGAIETLTAAGFPKARI